MTTACTVVPMQVFFNVKTPRSQLYAIVRTGKGEHAQFNNNTTLQVHKGADSFTVYIQGVHGLSFRLDE